jgi:hypothetical protein
MGVAGLTGCSRPDHGRECRRNVADLPVWTRRVVIWEGICALVIGGRIGVGLIYTNCCRAS